MKLLNILNSLDEDVMEQLVLRLRYTAVQYVGGGCLEWQGGLNRDGYGVVCVSGKNCYTHRVVVALEGIDVDSYEVVRHLCDNLRCCNPAHLRAGTHSENLRDRWRTKKG